MGPVGERDPLAVRARQARGQRRAVPTGLLVRPLAGQEGGGLDLVHERDRRHRIGHLGHVVVVGPDLAHQVDGLAVQRLVGLAGLVSLLNALVGPGLTLPGAGRLGVVDAVLGPLHREAGVEDAAGIERRLGGVDQRERCDRGQRGRVGLGGEELADAAVGDAHHSHLAELDPGLARHGLDHVVAVQALQRLEEVERAARAAGAAHVHVDDRHAHHVAQDRDAALRPGRVGVAVAPVLDQGRRRAGRDLRQRNAGARGVRHVLGRMHVEGQLGAVARGQIAVAAGGDRLVVDLRARGRRPRGEHRQRPRLRSPGGKPDAIADPRLHVAEHEAALRVGSLRGDLPAGAIEQRHLRARRQVGHVDLLDAAVRAERRLGHTRSAHERERQGGSTHRKTDPPHVGHSIRPCAALVAVPGRGRYCRLDALDPSAGVRDHRDRAPRRRRELGVGRGDGDSAEDRGERDLDLELGERCIRCSGARRRRTAARCRARARRPGSAPARSAPGRDRRSGSWWTPQASIRIERSRRDAVGPDLERLVEDAAGGDRYRRADPQHLLDERAEVLRRRSRAPRRSRERERRDCGRAAPRPRRSRRPSSRGRRR